MGRHQRQEKISTKQINIAACLPVNVPVNTCGVVRHCVQDTNLVLTSEMLCI